MTGKAKIALALILLAICFAAVFKFAKKDAGGNLILFTLDTVRADRLGCYGYEKISTPNIDYLAANGVLFENAIATAPLTLPSHTTILTGLYPQVHGIRDNTTYKLSEKAVTLAEVLSEHGYKTGAVIGSFVLDSYHGLDQGFAVYNDEMPGPEPRSTDVFGEVGPEKIRMKMKKISERPSSAVTMRASTWLKKNKGERFFLWIHYYDAHHPYTPPPDFSSKYAEVPYDGEIASVDKGIGVILDELRSSGLIENTLVVIAGDHGEGLGEHEEQTHSIFIYESTVRVPLIMSYPDEITGSKRVDAVVSLVDVMPTILDILDIDHSLTMDGVSLLGMIEGNEPRERAVYSESMFPYLNYGWSELQSVRTSDWKYIRSPEPELYNVKEDPAELRNIISERRDVAERLETALDSLIAVAADEDSGLAEEASLSDSDRERLAALGYVSGAPPALEQASLKNPREMIRFHDLIYQGAKVMEEGRYEEALAIFKEVISEEPTNALARHLLGMAYYQREDYKSAQEEFLEAIKLNPNLSDAHHNLGNIYLQDGKLEEAAACYEKAIELDPRAGEYYIALGQIYARMGKMEQARSAYEKAIGFGYSSPQLFLAHGITLMQLGRFEEARKNFEGAIAIDPNNTGAFNEYGNLLAKIGDLQGAAAKYRQAISIDPNHAQSHHNLARILIKTQKEGEAIRELLLCAEKEPGHAETHYLLGELFFRNGEKEKAREHLAKFLALGTTNQAARDQAQAHLLELK